MSTVSGSGGVISSCIQPRQRVRGSGCACRVSGSTRVSRLLCVTMYNLLSVRMYVVLLVSIHNTLNTMTMLTFHHDADQNQKMIAQKHLHKKKNDHLHLIKMRMQNPRAMEFIWTFANAPSRSLTPHRGSSCRNRPRQCRPLWSHQSRAKSICPDAAHACLFPAGRRRYRKRVRT